MQSKKEGEDQSLKNEEGDSSPSAFLWVSRRAHHLKGDSLNINDLIKSECKKFNIRVSRKRTKRSFEKLLKSLEFEGFILTEDKIKENEVELKKEIVRSGKKRIVIVGEEDTIKKGFQISQELNKKPIIIPLYPSSKEILENIKNARIYIPFYFWEKNGRKLRSGILDLLSYYAIEDIHEYSQMSLEITKNIKRIKDVERAIILSSLASNYSKIKGLEHEIVKKTEELEHGELVTLSTTLILYDSPKLEEYLRYVKKYGFLKELQDLLEMDLEKMVDVKRLEAIKNKKYQEIIKNIKEIIKTIS